MAEIVAGVDEVGRGCIAGFVVAAAVILPTSVAVPAFVDDSKKLSEEQRVRANSWIQQNAMDYAIGSATVAEIDQHNILQASLMAMARAIEQLKEVDSVMIDGIHTPKNLPERLQTQTVKGGDALYPNIAAASILAKVYRDQAMRELEQRYPGYGFSQHKGYPTPTHLRALTELGPCAEHRQSFAPVKKAQL